MDYNLGYSPVLAGNIRSHDVFKPIACEQKYLMDYNAYYSMINDDQRSSKDTCKCLSCEDLSKTFIQNFQYFAVLGPRFVSQKTIPSPEVLQYALKMEGLTSCFLFEMYFCLFFHHHE